MGARRAIAVGVIAIVAGGAVAGCGGSGDAATTEPPADAGFVAEANAICAAATAEFNALGNTQQFQSLEDFRDRFGQAIDIARRQYADISRLDPPREIADDVAAYLEEGGRSVQMTEDLYNRVLAGEDLDVAEGATIGSAEGQSIIAARRSAAAEAGLSECAAS